MSDTPRMPNAKKKLLFIGYDGVKVLSLFFGLSAFDRRAVFHRVHHPFGRIWLLHRHV